MTTEDDGYIGGLTPEIEAKIYAEMAAEEEQIRQENREAGRYVRHFIDYPFRWVNDTFHGVNSWRHEGFVEIEHDPNYKNCFYPKDKFFVEKNSGPCPIHYMLQADRRPKSRLRRGFHSLVWQLCQLEDSYSGFILYPLKDGRYWKISFSC